MITTEAEYIALSQALREAIPIMNLVQELQDHNFFIFSQTTRVFCTAFEDNNGALELARTPKMRSRTKHINLVYHHFRDYVSKGLINVLPIDTTQQVADIFTKPLDAITFAKLRKTMLGW